MLLAHSRKTHKFVITWLCVYQLTKDGVGISGWANVTFYVPMYSTVTCESIHLKNGNQKDDLFSTNLRFS
jgi:hypothetical protein